jgi:predicted transcriptional regulator/adenine/guanine phosphoribosyltransferase-like PRPP-binding protein
MDKQKTQNNIIIKTLLEDGVFSISEIENKINLSRSSLSKNLKKLVDSKILSTTSKLGSAVKYKLAINREAFSFLFSEINYVTIINLSNAWGVSVSSAKKYIKEFVDNGLILKQGSAPKKIIYTFNYLNDKYDLTKKQQETIDKYYIYLSPDGQILRGLRGFIYWAENKSNRKNIELLAQEYLDTRNKYYKNKNEVFLIDATDKLEKVFPGKIYLKKLFHRDFDALPVFGKTYLSQMIRIAKSGQENNIVMSEIVSKIQLSIDTIISKYDINAVGFIPPTIARKTQLMSFLAKKLKINLPLILIEKIKGFAPVQQKSLKKIEDRILNAKKTIAVNNSNNYENVLLIDDVTGSGATLNETAQKLIEKGIAKNVYGFTITGSAKAGIFDIISEA